MGKPVVEKGFYILLICLPKSTTIKVGKLGELALQKGHYAYVGSARHSLMGRVKRYFNPIVKTRWHIDYLLKEAKPWCFLALKCESPSRFMECEIAKRLRIYLHPIPSFGSSDCNCKSHLFFSQDPEALFQICFEVLSSFVLKQTKR